MSWRIEKQRYCKEEFSPTARVHSWGEREATHNNIVTLHQWLRDLLRQPDIQNKFRQVIEWFMENPAINKFRRTREPLLPPAPAVSPAAYPTRSSSSIGLFPAALDGCSILPEMPLWSSNLSSPSASGAAASHVTSPPIIPSASRRSLVSYSSASSLSGAPINVLHQSSASNNLASVVPPSTPLPQFPYFSIMRAYFPATKNWKFIAIFKLSTQAGQFGVVKIGYIIEQQQDKYVLKQPAAVKIVRDYTTFLDSIPTAESWLALYPECIYVVERSSEEQALAKYNYDQDALQKAREHVEDNSQLAALKPKYYFTMPWFEGYEFYEVLNLPVDQFNFLEKLKISIALIAALQKLHKAGWVHRDLKAENIIIQRLTDGTFVANLVDLDQAKKNGEAVDFFGTFEYLDPELLKQAKRNQCRASFSQDVFALGILLAELWVGSCSVLEERLNIINRLIEIDKRDKSNIQREVCMEMFAEIAADRGCLAKDICIASEPAQTLSWAELYFPGIQVSLIRDIYRPIKEVMFHMMDPASVKRPTLDAVEAAFNLSYGKVKKFTFQPKPCVLFDVKSQELSDLPQIEVPVC
ncbi:MAG: protein kinase [Gammaproteobacteria bacterium]|nr:protein kinase [Gammaproteobacteria bacterium]